MFGEYKDYTVLKFVLPSLTYVIDVSQYIMQFYILNKLQ